MQTLYPNVPKYGEVPRGVSDSQMLASLEGRPAQQPAQMPIIGKVGQDLQKYPQSGTVSTTQPVPQPGEMQQNIQAQPQQQQGTSGNQAATNAATSAATSAAANYAAGQATGTGAGAGMGAAATAAAPYLAAAATAYAAYRGLDDSREAWEEGNRGKDVNKEFWLERTDGGGAAINAGSNDIFGEFIPQEWVREVGWRANPATAPFAIAEDLFNINPFTGKDQDQVDRDRVRTGLNRLGIMNDNYEFEMPDGQFYYAGKDGNTPEYQVQNPDRPLTGRVIGAAQVMAAIMLGEPGKRADDLTGQLTNMALSNATTYEQAMDNLMFQFNKFIAGSGLTPQAARDEIASWVNEGLIDQQAAEAYLAAHNSFLEGNPWQFTNEAANAPLQEGQAAPPAATFQFDPAANLRPGTSPGSSPTQSPSFAPTSTGPRPVTAPQAPKIAPARGAGPLPTQGPIKNLTPGTTPTAAASMTGTQRPVPPHIQEILLRVR